MTVDAIGVVLSFYDVSSAARQPGIANSCWSMEKVKLILIASFRSARSLTQFDFKLQDRDPSPLSALPSLSWLPSLKLFPKYATNLSPAMSRRR